MSTTRFRTLRTLLLATVALPALLIGCDQSNQIGSGDIASLISARLSAAYANSAVRWPLEMNVKYAIEKELNGDFAAHNKDFGISFSGTQVSIGTQPPVITVEPGLWVWTSDDDPTYHVMFLWSAQWWKGNGAWVTCQEKIWDADNGWGKTNFSLNDFFLHANGICTADLDKNTLKGSSKFIVDNVYMDFEGKQGGGSFKSAFDKYSIDVVKAALFDSFGELILAKGFDFSS